MCQATPLTIMPDSCHDPAVGSMAKKSNRKSGSGGRRGGRGQLLEQCVHGLKLRNINSYSRTDFAKLKTVPDTYVVLNYPHLSLYGTSGRKEAYIKFGGREYILETKLQDGSGSVDEKLPHVWECFLRSSVPNWIVVFDGRYWKSDLRGNAALTWFREFVEERRRLHNVPEERKFYIAGSLKEFFSLDIWE